jgi:hypothetical protein
MCQILNNVLQAKAFKALTNSLKIFQAYRARIVLSLQSKSSCDHEMIQATKHSAKQGASMKRFSP